MAQSTPVRLTGVLTAEPAPSGMWSGSFSELMPLDVCATYGATKSGAIHATGSELTPFVIPLEGIAKVRFFAIRLRSGATMTLLVTTAQGVARVPVSDLWFFHNPAVGDEATALRLITVPAGVDVQYVISGDVT